MHKKLLGRSCLLLVVVTLVIASPAQDTQRFEAFGGYSFSYNTLPIYNKSIFNGWDGSSTVFVNRWFGVTADFSGTYGSQKIPLYCYPGGCVHERESLSSYTYLFGPHLVYRHKRYAPFGETLAGLHNPHLSSTLLDACNCQLDFPAHTSYHKFAMAVGGGLDIALSHGISIRPVEVDYLLLRDPTYKFENGNLVYYGTNNNTFRYSGGINFRFGEHLGSSR